MKCSNKILIYPVKNESCDFLELSTQHIAQLFISLARLFYCSLPDHYTRVWRELEQAQQQESPFSMRAVLRKRSFRGLYELNLYPFIHLKIYFPNPSLFTQKLRARVIYFNIFISGPAQHVGYLRKRSLNFFKMILGKGIKPIIIYGVSVPMVF